mmetsp:Transcript_136006/g.235940  ORF Transcript_136006/g.235940 Transcript_136006/m.235940 type:complete len:331 (+) Transcript_136006:892-1884(+)
MAAMSASNLSTFCCNGSSFSKLLALAGRAISSWMGASFFSRLSNLFSSFLICRSALIRSFFCSPVSSGLGASAPGCAGLAANPGGFGLASAGPISTQISSPSISTHSWACADMSSSSQSASVSSRSSITALPSSTVITCVQPRDSQKLRSWDTTTTAPLKLLSASVRLSTVSMSKWLEGSSSSSRLCGTSANRANATRAFSPPERYPISRIDLSPDNPKAPIVVRVSLAVSRGLCSSPAICTTSTAILSWGSSCARSCWKKPSLSPSPSLRLPDFKGRSPDSARSIVDFPAPLGPLTTMRNPLSIRRLTPVTMGFSPQPNAASVSSSCSS